jgi:hypothetical protein
LASAGKRAVDQAEAMMDVTRQVPLVDQLSHFAPTSYSQLALPEEFRIHAYFPTQLTSILCSSADSFPGIAKKMQTDLKAANKATEKLTKELAGMEARRLLDGLSDGASVLSLHREEGAATFLSAVADVLLSDPNFIESGSIAMLTGSDVDGGLTGSFLLVGPPQLVKEAGGDVAGAMEARGGGRPGRFQGKANRIDLRGEALENLRTHVSTSLYFQL